MPGVNAVHSFPSDFDGDDDGGDDGGDDGESALAHLDALSVHITRSPPTLPLLLAPMLAPR